MTPAFGPCLFLLFLCFAVPYIVGSGIVAWQKQKRLDRKRRFKEWARPFLPTLTVWLEWMRTR